MTDSTKVLINKRAGIKGSLTRYKNFIQNITPESRFSTHEILARRGKLPELYAKFTDVQSEIEVLEEEKIPATAAPTALDDLRTAHATQCDDFETIYFQVFALYDVHLRTNVNTTTAPAAPGNTSSPATNRDRAAPHSQARVLGTTAQTRAENILR